MSERIIIDKNTCIGCGLCVKDCPVNCLILEGGKANYTYDRCMECGHCYAICPVGAVNMRDYDTSELGDYVPFAELGAREILQAMKSRRTIRHFQDRPVEEEKVVMILEAGRYTQTARNTQDIAYHILGSKQEEVEKICVSMVRKAMKMGSLFSKQARGFEIGEDFLFKGAPLVIVVTGRSTMDRGLATSYMEIMANALGLGVLVSGFTETCISKSPKLKRMIELPFGHEVLSVMVIGYPDVQYKHPVPRKPANVKKL